MGANRGLDSKSHPNFPKDTYEGREVVNAILYLMRTGCQSRHLPHDFPAWSSVANYYYDWKKKRIVDNVADRLRRMAREALGRTAEPSLGIIDSQSSKTTEVAVESGYDAGKKSQGQKAAHPCRRLRSHLARVGYCGEHARS